MLFSFLLFQVFGFGVFDPGVAQAVDRDAVNGGERGRVGSARRRGNPRERNLARGVVEVSLEGKCARVTVDATVTDEALMAAVNDLGFTAKGVKNA